MAIENRIGKVKSEKKGLLLDFSKSKIATAIMNAAKDVGGLSNSIDPNSIYRKFKGEKDEVIAQLLTEDVILCLNMQHQYRSPHLPPTLEEIHDVVIDVLKDRGFVSVSSSYSIYREGQRAIRMRWLAQEKFAGNGFPKASFKKSQKWYEKMGVSTIEDLNKKIKQGELASLVEADTQRYEKELRQAVNKFQREQQKRDLRVMIIAGPSSSGKTTTSEKLCSYLEAKGYRFKLVAVDNYFFSTAEYPRDWFGDMNYELPESINLQLLNRHLAALLAGKKIFPPIYNFKDGTSTSSKTPIRLEKNEILLLDCLHGLYPQTTVAVPDEQKFKVYIENHPAIKDKNGKYVKFTDIRLIRRMCRDVRNRGYSVQYTLEHWATVRKGEFKGIIPFSLTADATVNGGLIFDLPVLKQHLLGDLGAKFDEQTLESYKDKGRMDAYSRGKRIKSLLQSVVAAKKKDIKKIPQDNLIREFIGH